MSAARPLALPALGLRGAALGYLGLMIVLPLAALAWEAAQGGAGQIIKDLTNPFAVHALKLTFITAAIMVAINTVTGTATAWVLARYEFPGKSIMNALIDVPVAIPTIVTGLMLVVLYGPSSTLGAILGSKVIYQQPGIILALMFVTYPFVVRSVQPVLHEMDWTEEEAALTLGAGPWLTFRRVLLPTLWPAMLTGAAQSFSRALGEFGSVILVAGNRPMQTKTAPMHVFGELESGNRLGAISVSLALLACSLGILLVLNALQRRGGDHD